MKRNLSALCLILTLGVLVPAQAQERKPDPTGTWRWNVANPDGRIPEITFTLKLHGETLTGTRTAGTRTMAITNGVFKGDEISFQTVREGKAGKTTTTYSGKLSGDTIAGEVEIDAGGKTFSSDWAMKREAPKAKSESAR